MLRYAITNLSALTSDHDASPEHARKARWHRNLQRWIDEGVDFIQLREKSLDAGEQLALAAEAADTLRNLDLSTKIPIIPKNPIPPRPRLLLNGRPDIAAAAHADGVHLTARPGELTPGQVRHIFRTAGAPRCTLSVSCRSLEQVERARTNGADLILFSPVFEKVLEGRQVAKGTGLHLLRAACRLAHPVPVLALGGVTPQNTPDCLTAGAAGIAAIRLFSQPEAAPKRHPELR